MYAFGSRNDTQRLLKKTDNEYSVDIIIECLLPFGNGPDLPFKNKPLTTDYYTLIAIKLLMDNTLGHDGVLRKDSKIISGSFFFEFR